MKKSTTNFADDANTVLDILKDGLTCLPSKLDVGTEVERALVQYWQPQEASIGTSAWAQMKVKTGLGRISYVADDYAKFDVPDDLTDVEYAKADNGRYLYICPSFTPALETFKAEEAQTVSVMEELRARVPEYSK